MSTIKVSTTIKAPIDEVWETVMDPYRFGEWVTIHRAIAGVSSMPLRTGSRMQQTLHMRGVSFHVQWMLTELKAPNRAEWAGRGPAHSRALILYELSANGENETKFDYTNEFTAPGGRLGNVASRVIVGAASEREAHNSLARLKALIERS